MGEAYTIEAPEVLCDIVERLRCHIRVTNETKDGDRLGDSRTRLGNGIVSQISILCNSLMTAVRNCMVELHAFNLISS